MIPNHGPNRYIRTFVPPDGSAGIQTAALEGSHGRDACARKEQPDWKL